ncbi:MAG: tetratricopeptide repeat protein [Leptolyngbya sp. IPPAS B-1204]|uniref:Tetratricopeptide repeat protein n=1 Tax=Leptolyngbya sp. NK1-12 TaxID=2547451 RepID=A0AA96WBF0_9CYAN|nr:tetratricopeptide repeat protein [Elainella sp. C42_A2020_010]RNJ67866.1 MAG: tetratricopeptide repeat protein [Leptolyngbya sp. IPPAS B-1204]WNZ21440.1 tetratricopeptide repeat protein [Leptolyngbya sp. NK1-12]
MLDQLAAAFDRGDYRTAASLLKQLQHQTPDNPWVKLYSGRLREVAGKLEAAETIYRQLLRETTNPKVAVQARQGLQRLTDLAQAQREAALAEAAADPANTGIGFLILDAVGPEQRQTAAQSFARIMKLDAYTARLLLPSRGWRLYRVGPLAELQLYGQDLLKAGIPSFWQALAKIQAIRVFRVHYLQAVSPQVTVVCENEAGQLGALSFDWSEVAKRVEGRLPIFEDVVDTDSRNQLTRKQKTQDYAQVIDLHLPRRNCMLRFCDWSYQYQQGVIFDASQDGELSVTQSTNRIRWNQLVYFLDHYLAAVPVWAEFPAFAETALEPLALVRDLKSHIDLLRKAPSRWDPAFQLYSGLVFAR